MIIFTFHRLASFSHQIAGETADGDAAAAFSESLRAFVDKMKNGTGLTCPVTFLTPSGGTVDDGENESKSTLDLAVFFYNTVPHRTMLLRNSCSGWPFPVVAIGRLCFGGDDVFFTRCPRCVCAYPVGSRTGLISFRQIVRERITVMMTAGNQNALTWVLAWVWVRTQLIRCAGMGPHRERFRGIFFLTFERKRGVFRVPIPTPKPTLNPQLHPIPPSSVSSRRLLPHRGVCGARGGML